MPRAGSERPSRRLDAILETLRRHGVKSFKAAKLDGVGEGLEWTFRPVVDAVPEAGQMSPLRRVSPKVEREPDEGDDDLTPRLPEPPIDELELVAQNREGLV